MKVKIDKSGRITIPKHIRKHLNLETGSELIVENTGKGIFLQPAEQTAGIIRKDGILVFQGKLQKKIEDEIKKSREDRLSNIIGSLE